MRAALLVLATLALAACTSDGDATPTTEATPTREASPTTEATETAPPAATRTPSPAPTATPQPAPNVEGEFRIEGFELLVLSVPFSELQPSHHAPDRLDRVYRDADGDIQVEVLLTGDEIGGFLLINSVVASPDGHEIVVATCRGDDCGAFGPTYEDALTVLHRSTDGGRTWSRYGEIDGIARPLLWHRGEIVVMVLTPIAGVSERVDWPLQRFPSGDPIVIPDGASTYTNTPGIDPATGDLRWRSADGRRWLNEDGNASEPIHPNGSNTVPWLYELDAGDYLRTWGTDPKNAARYTADGSQIVESYIVPYGCCRIAIDGAHALAGGVFPPPEAIEAYADELPQGSRGPFPRPAPAVLDTWTGVIQLITDPFMRSPYQDRDGIEVIAVVPGKPRSNPPSDTMTIEFPPTAPHGEPVEQHMGGQLAVFADGTLCAVLPIATNATIEVGTPDQPAACRRTGATLEFVDATGRLYYQQFEFRPGTTKRFINYGPPPAHTAWPHYICEHLRSRDLNTSECTAVGPGPSSP